MIPIPFSSFLDESAGKEEWSLLLEIVSAANRSQDIELLADRCLDALAALFPYRRAFVLIFEATPPSVVVAQARGIPDTLRAEIEALRVAPEFFADMEAPDGAYRFHLVTDVLRPLLSAEHPGTPILVPLLADGRALGILALMADSHPEVQGEWVNLQFRYKYLLDAVGAQMGIAIRRAQLERKL